MDTSADHTATEDSPQVPAGVAPDPSEALPLAAPVPLATSPPPTSRQTRQSDKSAKRTSKAQQAAEKTKQKEGTNKKEEVALALLKQVTAPVTPSGPPTPKTGDTATPPVRSLTKINQVEHLRLPPWPSHMTCRPPSTVRLNYGILRHNPPATVVKTTYPEGSYARILDDSAKPGMDRQVSEPDQGGWVKFAEDIEIHAGYKSKTDGKIYRVRIVAENPLNPTKGVITCYNQTMSVIPNSDVLQDPKIATPAVNGIDNITVNFPHNAPMTSSKTVKAHTVNTTTAASPLINSIAYTRPARKMTVLPTGTPATITRAPDVSHNITEGAGSVLPGISTVKPDPAENVTIPAAQLGQILRDQQLMSLTIAESLQSAVSNSSKINNLLLAQLLRGKEEDEDKNLARPRNIASKTTELPAFIENMADMLSPGRFLPAGTDLKVWGNSIPDKFEPRSNLALEEFGLVVNDFAAVYKAHDRTNSKLQLKHFKTDNLHKIEKSNKLKFDGTTGNFTQVSGVTNIQNVAQALESLANDVVIFHRICPANPEALTLFMAVLRNYLSRAVKVTTPDVKNLFVDWNIERISKIAAKEGTVGYKWVEDQLSKIVNTRVTKADEATNATINAIAEAHVLAKDNPAMRKRLSMALGNKFPSSNTNRIATFGNTNRKRQQVNPNTAAKKQKPNQQTRQNKPPGPSFCRYLLLCPVHK